MTGQNAINLERLLSRGDGSDILEFSLQAQVVSEFSFLDDQKEQQRRLRERYERLPEELRKLNKRYSSLITAVELGYLSKKLITYVWEKVLMELVEKRDPFEIYFAEVQREQFEPKERIFRQGENSDKLYFIEEGNVDIVLEERSGNKKLATLLPGSIFGEMGVVDDSKRSASAYAKGVVTTSTISKEELLKAVYELGNLDQSVVLLSAVSDTLKGE